MTSPSRTILVLCLLAAGLSAVAAEPPPQYDACLARAQNDPNGALAQATAWARTGGGAAADHCAAVALVGLRRYGEAAAKLDALARSSFAVNSYRKKILFDQAGNAWLLAGRADTAIASFTAGLAADAFDADLLSDRARALAMKKDWAKAESDLTAALLVNPDRADLYVLRGSARHAMGRKADARADFDLALRADPGNADALVERGTMKFEAGDKAGARADWQKAATVAPDSAAADAARQHLADTAAPSR
jgi:tetratricopeptide (TPR) repeat protein